MRSARKCIGFITVALGAGILLATVFPDWVLVFILSLVTINIGICIIRI